MIPALRRPQAARSELSEALATCRGAFIGVGVMSFAINVLYLTGSFFMLEIYDRVVPSRSIPTLVGLCVLALMLYAFQGVLEFLRGRVLVRVGGAIDEGVSRRVFDAVVRMPLKSRQGGDGLAPLRDLDQVRGFLGSLGPTALFDLPWMPLYLFICFLFHPLLGWTGVVGAVLLIGITLATERMTQAPTRSALEHMVQRNTLAEAGRRNAEVLHALGMGGRIGASWAEANTRYQDSQRRAADIAGGLGSASKVLRLALQSAVLAVGAYLVVHGQATGGIMIAASILVSRALAPVELAIAHWKGFVGARQGWRRLNDLLVALPADQKVMALPKPRMSLTVEGVAGAPPGVQKIVVQDVAFGLKAGQGLGIIGPSASGKSSLARVLVGVWQPLRGKVRLDGAALDQWSPEELGRSIGYLPQDVELFSGTIGQNIARFEPDADPKAIIAAAETAGVHEMILRQPEGYDTPMGEAGQLLSAGQRQRVALARALYGDPFLVVLDEPNSNLDAEGEAALTRAIMSVRARGGMILVVAHRPSALAGCDMVLVMAEGRQHQFGPKDEVLAKVLRQPAPAARAQPVAAAAARGSFAAPASAAATAAQPPLRIVSDAQGGSA